MSLSNHSARLIVSVLAIPLILAAIYFGKFFFLILILGISLISFKEFSTFVKNRRTFTSTLLGMLFILFFLLNIYFKILEDVFPLFAALVLLVSIVELFRNKESAINNIGATLLGALYFGLAGYSLIGIREYFPERLFYIQGGWIIIAVFISIWVCDSAAYYIGTAFGKHKLFPRVSPKKSWEGAIAGFLFAVIAFVIMKYIFLDFLSWGTIVAFGIITGIIGQIGDLFESLLKRTAGVKDSSNLIPGHGGIFDRFDSLFMTAPFIYVFLKYFAR